MSVVGRSFFFRRLALAILFLPIFLHAAEPVVQGKESVEAWFEQGQRFVRDSENLTPVRRLARNVIFFVGDGMGRLVHRALTNDHEALAEEGLWQQGFAFFAQYYH